MTVRSEGHVEISASGSGSLNAIRLTITSNSDDHLKVAILTSTIFEPQATDVAAMAVSRDRILSLEPRETARLFSIDAASINMERRTPGRNDILTLSASPAATSLTKLLRLADFQSASPRVQQFAVWTITDNPGRGRFQGIATGFSLRGSGPSDEEIERIRTLFSKAQIPLERYRVLQETIPVELVAAQSGGLLEVSASGKGTISRIQVSLTSRANDVLEVAILPGTLFEPQAAGVQNMVVILEKVLWLYPGETFGPVSLDAACANMELDAPGSADGLTLRPASASGDLLKLLELADFQAESARVQQFAIWTVTDNPARDQYRPIGTRFNILGKGPTDEEIESIRGLFEKAGIPMDTYQALRQE